MESPSSAVARRVARRKSARPGAAGVGDDFFHRLALENRIGMRDEIAGLRLRGESAHEFAGDRKIIIDDGARKTGTQLENHFRRA